ncbi:methyl-accepting chemotaxis protein [Sporomusaceae bacterium BoRhaA]|uniref:methyl-accepting chemotaxis protein n=1 Tax=Pelorhabdus rhamnosifermentans TaxID=2772457 RepID=UPI001C0624B6|nr:methyl-accepting chemotaxis protein [Pelorhabdus rhamnosifermentans]MBU2703955.1 methyl-accepting chemotaxis protein [Pelorhabdus rhamnosifermentans]
MLQKIMTHIQFKMIGVICLILIVTLGSVSLITYKNTEKTISKKVAENQQAIVQNYSQEIESEFNVLSSYAYNIATSDHITNTADKTQISQLLSAELKRFPRFDNLWYIDVNGNSVDSSGKQVVNADRDYVKLVIQTQKPYITNPYISKVTGKPTVSIVYPVFRNGKMEGMINAIYQSDKILDKIQQAKFGQTGYATLVGGDGVVVADGKNSETVGTINFLKQDIPADLNFVRKNIDERAVTATKEALSGNIAQSAYIGYDNDSRYAVFCPVQLGEQQRWALIITTEANEIYEDANRLLKWTLLISFIGLTIAGIIAYLFGRRFVGPILAINREMALVSQGNLRKRDFSVTSDDELGQIVRSFLVMKNSIIAIVEKVQYESQQVAASSEELTASAEQSAQAANQIASSITELAQGTEEQHTEVSESSAIIGQMSEGIQNVVVNANVLSQQSKQADETAKEGGKSVARAVKKMTEIEYIVSSSAQVIAQLGKRSKEIGQIVDTISTISGQTNLLALNAAIEAARAGEQGRGFAVVAEEVRQLAEQSQEAAKKIAHLIGEVQSETDKAVSAMEDGKREVTEGTDIVNEAGKAFQDIISLVTNLANQISGFSDTIIQLGRGSQKIVASVQQIDHLAAVATGEAQTVSATTEEQSASMEQIASASQGLSQLAQNLLESIGKFHTR